MSVEPIVRRNVWTLPSGDETVAEYARAVAIMQARHASDPTSWEYQAAMHGTHTGPPKPLWNGCQHGTWFFLAWHRMFIYHFEQIVRAAVVQAGGSASWALPFWAYDAGGEQATLPLAFRTPKTGSETNPLYVAARAKGINEGLAIPPQVATAAVALARHSFVGTTEFGGGITAVAQFSSATGQLENTPHNVVHDQVGGKSGLMSDPDKAARDPIFWLHHSNIDRLWSVWNGAGHANPVDRRWTGQAFSFFDPAGAEVSLTAAQVLDIVSQLGYTYETVASEVPHRRVAVAMSAPAPADPPPEPELVGASAAAVRLAGAPASVTFEIDSRAQAAALAERGLSEPERIVLAVEDVEAEQNPGIVYGVYLNLAPAADAATAESHYAGNVSFFGVERARNPRGDEPAHGLRFVFDVTALTRQLAAEQEWDGVHVTATFRPLGLIPAERPELAHELPGETAEVEPVTIGRVSLLYG